MKTQFLKITTVFCILMLSINTLIAMDQDCDSLSTYKKRMIDISIDEIAIDDIDEDFDEVFILLSRAKVTDKVSTPLTSAYEQKEITRLKKSAKIPDNISVPLDTEYDLKESNRLLKSIKNVEPGCCQYVQSIPSIPQRWELGKLEEPFYDISAYTPGCGTFSSIFCCLFSSCVCTGCWGEGQRDGGCYFYEDDLVCFGNYKDGKGKVMTRRDAIPIMEAVNRETFEYCSNEIREETKLKYHYSTHPRDRSYTTHTPYREGSGRLAGDPDTTYNTIDSTVYYNASFNMMNSNRLNNMYNK